MKKLNIKKSPIIDRFEWDGSTKKNLLLNHLHLQLHQLIQALHMKKTLYTQQCPLHQHQKRLQKNIQILKRRAEILRDFFATNKTQDEYRKLFTVKEVFKMYYKVFSLQIQNSTDRKDSVS